MLPHAEFDVPALHCPLEEQQPLQFKALHGLHAPPPAVTSQRWFDGHTWQAPPDAPHADSAVPAMH